jgi:PTS system nitrogen regulatory IIA component
VNIVVTNLGPGDILLDVDVANKEQLFGLIDQHMACRHAMPEGMVAAGLARREKVGSTGLGEGVAIPHARVKNLSRIRIAYLRLKTPIPFDAPDGGPVKDVLVLLVPKQATEEHLQLLADATQFLARPKFREQLHMCGLAADVRKLFSNSAFA